MDDPLGKAHVKTPALTETENYWHAAELNFRKGFIEFLSHITKSCFNKSSPPDGYSWVNILKTIKNPPSFNLSKIRQSKLQYLEAATGGAL